MLAIAGTHIKDERLTLICADGNDWLRQNVNEQFNFIFADSWPGKYMMLDETLAMLKQGGIYFIDDMLPQENWPAGHAEKADRLLEELNSRDDLFITEQSWASGIVIVTKK